MRRDWTREELSTASEMMKQNGHMGFEEFCRAIEQNQPVSFDLRERDRKELVKAISEILGEKAECMRMPTCAYRIGGYTVAKDGTLTWGADVTDAEVLLQALTARGWNYAIVIDTAVTEETQPEVKAESDTGAYDFCVELPEETLPDALLQKTYTVSVLDKKRSTNNGQRPKYYIEGSHEAIISKDVFMRVQSEIARRANLNPDGKRRVYSSKYALSGMVFCGHCGDIYRRVKWNNRGCKSTVWRCVSRVLKKDVDFDCPARTVKEEVLQGKSSRRSMMPTQGRTS